MQLTITLNSNAHANVTPNAWNKFKTFTVSRRQLYYVECQTTVCDETVFDHHRQYKTIPIVHSRTNTQCDVKWCIDDTLTSVLTHLPLSHLLHVRWCDTRSWRWTLTKQTKNDEIANTTTAYCSPYSWWWPAEAHSELQSPVTFFWTFYTDRWNGTIMPSLTLAPNWRMTVTQEDDCVDFNEWMSSFKTLLTRMCCCFTGQCSISEMFKTFVARTKIGFRLRSLHKHVIVTLILQVLLLNIFTATCYYTVVI